MPLSFPRRSDIPLSPAPGNRGVPPQRISLNRSRIRLLLPAYLVLFGLSCNTAHAWISGSSRETRYVTPTQTRTESFAEKITPSKSIASTSTPLSPTETPNANPAIGLIRTGDIYSDMLDRLTALGYSVELIPASSDGDTLRRFDIVYLPTGWAEQQNDSDFQAIESRADSYREFLADGGSLLVEQPNPYQREGNMVTPSILPYPATFKNFYDKNDWPPVIVRPDHYITRGLKEETMPGPADQLVDVDPAYTVLVRGRYTNSPSLAVATYERGRILILADTSSLSATIPFGNDVFRRIIEWLSGF
jgi:hypothetical protein